MLSIVLCQLQKSYFFWHLPVVDSASVVFNKRGCGKVIQPISYELKSQQFPLEFGCVMVGQLDRTNKKNDKTFL